MENEEVAGLYVGAGDGEMSRKHAGLYASVEGEKGHGSMPGNKAANTAALSTGSNLFLQKV